MQASEALVSHAEERLPALAPTAADADHWREAAQLRGMFRGWIVIWLASEGEFRAYRRLPGTRRDTALTATTSEQMSAAIRQAEKARASAAADGGTGQR
jgi:hypothetical protein